MTISRPLPFVRLRTADLPPAEAAELWRHTMAVTHDVVPLDDADPAPFTADSSAWHLGPMLVIPSAISAQRIMRSAQRAHADQIDHYAIYVMRRGRLNAYAGDDAIRAQAGEPYVLDLARPIDAQISDTDSVTVMLPRDFLDEALGPADLHALADRLPALTQAEAPYVARATRDMIAACLAPNLDRTAAAAPQFEMTLMLQAKRHIDRRLQAPDLSADELCAVLGISRSSLYRLFARYGGVAAYIQGRRLDRIRARLADPTERRKLSELAQAYGFSSDAHFSAAFRRRFGMSPREARAGGPGIFDAAAPAAMATAEEYHGWLRGLRERPDSPTA
jgi:AraC-like DNA-binding protein